MKNLRILTGFILVSFLLSGCISLKTREHKASVKKESEAVLALRKQNADLRAKILEYEEQFRESTGKIEELEISQRRMQDSAQKRLGEESQQLQAYKESVAELLEEKKKLENNIVLLKEENKGLKQDVVAASRSAKEHLDEGDKFFDDKKWTEAAAEYQLFRKKVNKTQTEDYALATYKIGVCFQELGLKKEAKTFYKSVVSKHKKFKAAKYARYRLDNIK